MPKSDETAAAFMAGGRGDMTPAPWSAEIDVCYPQHAKFGQFDADGKAAGKVGPDDHDPKPENKNPRSVSDQNPEHDSQGK